MRKRKSELDHDRNDAIYVSRGVVQLTKTLLKAIETTLPQHAPQASSHTQREYWKRKFGS